MMQTEQGGCELGRRAASSVQDSTRTKESMMQHTPGPWYDHDGYVDAMDPSDDDAVITIAEGVDSSANARLIASAPELLAAAQGVLVELVLMLRLGDGSTPLDYAYEELVNVVNKATGVAR